MDLFSKNKLLFWAVIILAILNIILLSMFWHYNICGPKHYFLPPPPNQAPERFHAKEFFRHELNLDDKQMQQFRDMMDTHFKKTGEIMEQIHSQRKTLLDEVFSQKADKDKINKIADEIGRLHTDLEKANTEHFEALKTLIKPEQFEKLKGILDEVMMNQRPMREGHPEGCPPMGCPPKGECPEEGHGPRF
jgi:Spy/CpxP family protein refolding chaperone